MPSHSVKDGFPCTHLLSNHTIMAPAMERMSVALVALQLLDGLFGILIDDIRQIVIREYEQIPVILVTDILDSLQDIGRVSFIHELLNIIRSAACQQSENLIVISSHVAVLPHLSVR